MTGYTIPPDTRAAGVSGHVTDHNNISDDITTLVSHVQDGLTGATAAYRMAGGTASGAPVSGTFAVGDVVVDQTAKLWICTVAGSPGTWTQSGFSSPMTTLGDIIYENSTPTAARLAGNTTATKNFLTQTGTGAISAVPAWGTIAVGDLPTVTIAKGGTGQTTQQAALNALAAAQTANQVLAGDGVNVTLRALAAADLPTGTTAAKGALQLDGTAGDIVASPGTAAAGATGKAADAAHVHGQPTMFAPTGLTGATAASRYVGATASGAPGSGTFVVGDHIIDQTGTAWVCTSAGTPGTWTQIIGGAGSIPGGAAGGDLTGTYPNPTVGTNKITNAKAAQMATLTIKGNQTSATANAADMTAAQAMSVLNGLAYALANNYAIP